MSHHDDKKKRDERFEEFVRQEGGPDKIGSRQIAKWIVSESNIWRAVRRITGFENKQAKDGDPAKPKED